MTHPIYTKERLANKSIKALKEIAGELGIAPEGDKRKFAAWENAIINHQSAQVEKVEDEQPIDLPQPGDTHFIGNFLLRCAAVDNGGYAVVWDVEEDDVLLGEIKMDWECLWYHPMALNAFATPQEAVADLYESLHELIRDEDDVDFVDDGYHNFEARVDGVAFPGGVGKAIAQLSHDRFDINQPWYVSVSGLEIYRSALWCDAADWVRSQYVADTLPKHQPQAVQVLQPTELDKLLDKPFDELTTIEWRLLLGPELAAAA